MTATRTSPITGKPEVVWHEPTPTTVEHNGGSMRNGVSETHPAYGVLKVSRWTSTPGAVLFQSDIRHSETVVLSVERASVDRDLNRDWVHGEGRDLIEIQMSLAQWASAVSSFGIGGGVPVTIRKTETDFNVPGLVFEPRLALSMAETKAAADVAFGDIEAAWAAVEALDKKAPAAERNAAMGRLRNAINHAKPNVAFASESLVKHTEDVVQKARADVEAMATTSAHTLGIEAPAPDFSAAITS